MIIPNIDLVKLIAHRPKEEDKKHKIAMSIMVGIVIITMGIIAVSRALDNDAAISIILIVSIFWVYFGHRNYFRALELADELFNTQMDHAMEGDDQLACLVNLEEIKHKIDTGYYQV